MNRPTRIALELLKKYESATLTAGKTTVDGRGKGANLYINFHTARALERRELGVITYGLGDSTIDITVAGVEFEL